MGTRQLKKHIFSLLQQPSLEQILSEIVCLPVKETVNGLFSAICQVDEKLRWYGISCMGLMMARLAEENMEEARMMMRRLLWSLNDESGGIGWGAPETMAESMYHHQKLAEEYVHMLISYTLPDGPELEQDGNFLEHETLQRGLLWGLNRLCACRRDLLQEKGGGRGILFYLQSGDAQVRGLAARLCGCLSIGSAREQLQSLCTDKAFVRWYHDGRFTDISVEDFAQRSLAQLEV